MYFKWIWTHSFRQHVVLLKTDIRTWLNIMKCKSSCQSVESSSASVRQVQRQDHQFKLGFSHQVQMTLTLINQVVPQDFCGKKHSFSRLWYKNRFNEKWCCRQTYCFPCRQFAPTAFVISPFLSFSSHLRFGFLQWEFKYICLKIFKKNVW